MKIFIIILLTSCLCACMDSENPAPVHELHWRAAAKHPERHVVLRGETLYAIAFRYEKDYLTLAQINHISRPYTLRVGQVILLQSNIRNKKPAPTFGWREKQLSWNNTARVQHRLASWYWPIKGRIVTSFMPSAGKKGIDISGVKGEKVIAASGGVVAYAGSGLLGYGNLIIIKHNNQYLTAYGNNSRNLVREGQSIRAGQAIAEIGKIERRFYGVHFEIRKSGVPVNPLNYLG